MADFLRKKILIDTDLGDDVDDTAALIMALYSPELDCVHRHGVPGHGGPGRDGPGAVRDVPSIAMDGVFGSSLPGWNIKCDPEAARIVTDLAGHLTMF